MRTRYQGYIVCGFIIAGALAAFGAGQSPTIQKTAPPQSIHVEVEMVSLPVVVTNRDGRRVTDLTADDFTVLEDGVQQKISGFNTTDEPVDVLLALDTSGSVQRRLALIQNEAVDFVNQLHPDDEVAVMSFSQDVTLQQDFSIDRNRNARAIRDTRAGGSTVVYEAVWLGLEEVLKPVTERSAFVLFTDGVDTASRKASMQETLELAKETKATIYSVYFNTQADMGRGAQQRPMGRGRRGMSIPPIFAPGGSTSEYQRGRTYLSQLSENSGGKVFDALKMEDLSSAFREIANELASQYSIGYYSTNQKHDGSFRKIEVRVNRPGLIARTKKGFYGKKD
jgi:VWFA-related protein